MPSFAEPVDEAERLERTGWPVGVDGEHDEPDSYTDEELESWGYGPSTPERRRTWPASPEAAATAVVARSLGGVVARYRRRRGWSQRVLARRLGTDQPRVSRLEHGRSKHMTVAQLGTLALETGLTLTLRIAPASAPGRAGHSLLRILDVREAVLPRGGLVELAVDAPTLLPPPAASGLASSASRPDGSVGRGAWGIP